jgi:transposase
MLIPTTDKKIYIASQAIDFRMSMNSLSELIMRNKNTTLYDGSIYVFFNKSQDKIKCLFWDKNGFVLYYKRLEGTKFKFMKLSKDLQSLTSQDLQVILSGYDPNKAIKVNEQRHLIEHKY